MNIALIGYGEVGRILGEDLRAAGRTMTAFDLVEADRILEHLHRPRES